ncbi:MAG: AAA family ATPase, partial [Cyclobacteriaceae bacterium]|nr:AAA family ATPase [Cyclobacteriaceae bacterium]
MADIPKKKKSLIPSAPQKPNYQVWIILSLVLLFFSIFYFNQSAGIEAITERRFEEMVRKGHVKEILVVKNQELVEVFLNEEGIVSGEYNIPEKPSMNFNKSPDFIIKIVTAENFLEKFVALEDELPEDKRIGYEIDPRSDFTNMIFNWGFLFLILIIFWVLMRRMTGAGGPGGQIFNVGKSKAALFDANNKIKTTFADVAGLDEAKEEVKEIVDFLKEPAKFTNLGGKIPKGALLVGAPGTGKTLLARAVAGEAEVPFFSLSGSDFVEMFVGVGAARVRDLFKQAKEKAPCIVFIDEIDAIGRSRARGQMPGSNDERENT